MTEHLPECPLSHIDYWKFSLRECICLYLRACEQRVLAEREADGPWFRSVVHDCCEDKQTAYAAGLDAAREAVEAVEHHLDAEVDYDRDYAFDPSGGTRNPRIWLRDALSAIDALKEKP